MFEQLKKAVCRANKLLPEHSLVVFSWGNVSGIDREKGAVAIKPSGVEYDALTPEDIVVLDIEGRVIEGKLRPSSDTPTHLELYRAYEHIGGICHTHSTYAAMWAQAIREIPCFGTTHADYAYGSVPITDILSREEVESDYERNTGRLIVRCMKEQKLDPKQFPGILVAGHGPFTWGDDPLKAVESAVILENIARMALGTLQLNIHQNPIPQYLLDKHFLRKHGKNAYYGQK